jgi:methylglyoxal synthase
MTGAGTECTRCCSPQRIAAEIAKDELNHVIFLRSALGSAAVDIPKLNMCARLAHACPMWQI